MNLDSVPDPIFIVSSETTRPFRIISCSSNSPEELLRDFAYRPDTRSIAPVYALDEDEPLNIVCGVENKFAGIFEEDESPIDDFGIRFERGRWVVDYNLNHHYHRSVFGKHNSRLKSLEREYACSMTVESLDVVRICGSSKTNVIRLLMHISEQCLPSNLDFTHFICLPLARSPEIQSSLSSLHSQVSDPVLKSALMPPSKLHFTLCMLKLTDDSSIDRVKSIMDRYRQFFTPEPVKVDLRGIDCMEPDPQHMRVAYTGGVGGEAPSGWRMRISELADKLMKDLRAEGFIDPKKQKSFFDGNSGKLHATVLNLKYAKGFGSIADDDSDGGDDASGTRAGRVEWAPPTKARSEPRKKGIDGRSFLTKFEHYAFGQVRVNELRLCRLVESPDNAKDPEGFYQTDLVVYL